MGAAMAGCQAAFRLDGEACAGDGREGIRAVFAERKRRDGAMALARFDVLHLDSRGVMRQPSRDRG